MVKLTKSQQDYVDTLKRNCGDVKVAKGVDDSTIKVTYFHKTLGREMSALITKRGRRTSL